MRAKIRVKSPEYANAYEIAGFICDELEKLPKKEQTSRLKSIRNIKIARKNPKRVSTVHNHF